MDNQNNFEFSYISKAQLKKIADYVKFSVDDVLSDSTFIRVQNNLEELIKSSSRNKYSPQYTSLKSSFDFSSIPTDKLPSNLIEYVFGRGVLGVRNMVTGEGKIVNDLSPIEILFVYYHELAHALGITDEMQADDFAARHTGYMISRDYKSLGHQYEGRVI